MYKDLSLQWQRVFALEWISLCEGSKAIAAVIADKNGNILSEGRNMISENGVPNPSTAHAEAEAIRNFDITAANIKECTLYAGLEPCIMCMGTLVMGGIRRVVIAARDDFGGAMSLIEKFDFARRKNIEIVWLDNELGDMQRAFQTVRELLYNTDEAKKARMLADFSVYNKTGVDAALRLVNEGYFNKDALPLLTAESVFDRLMNTMKQ
ncbi:MAG: nucleoside deaminase [Ruminiclostridium sp.]|nr:nucleoside deaminase [Ruminiclostridium sp.]MBQ8825994.1 nucleoside deaminase [Oscillospiraceae bacterium]